MAWWERDPKRVAALAESVGCRVIHQERMWDGEPAYALTCPSTNESVKLLDRLAWEDARDPNVRRIAERILAVSGPSRLEQLEAFHEFVRDGITFTTEPTEMFSSPLKVLESGIGDCDDSTRLLVALLRSVGISSRMQTLGNPPTHIVAQGWDGKDWLWLEATINARVGEHPKAAAYRLGLKMRSDLGV